MRSIKNYSVALLASSCLLTSCFVSRPGLYNPRIKQFAHDASENHDMRAATIASKEEKQPQGFIAVTQDFAVSKHDDDKITRNEAGEPVLTRIKGRIGIHIKDSTYFLQGRDFSQPPDARCNYAATVYLGKYQDQSKELQAMFSEAEAAITTSKRTLPSASKTVFYNAVDSNRIKITRPLGGGFTQTGLVNLKQKTLAPGACDFLGSASQKAYQDNRAMVELARKCAHSNKFRADGYTHYIKN